MSYQLIFVDAVSTLSEKISSRVAECTRLILVKDGFGGDLGTLDRWANGRRKNTSILEWFGQPERNTLRPLGSCIDCASLSVRPCGKTCLLMSALSLL
jgi:hypothetical protein